MNLKDLKLETLYKSPVYQEIVCRIDYLKDEIRRLLREDSIQGMTKEEFEDLSKIDYFFSEYIFYLGPEFKKKYYSDGDWEYSCCFDSRKRISVSYPTSYPWKLNENQPDLDKSGILDKIIPLNDEIIKLGVRLTEISENFDRFINNNTSLVWLKENFPKLYLKLKDVDLQTSP